MRKDLIPYNPKKTRKKAELARHAKVEYLTEDEYVALLGECDKPEHKLMMRLLWETGLRIGEVLGLRYGEIYPDGVNILGKGRKQRFVNCQASVLGELLRHQKEHGNDRIFQKITTEPGALYMMRRYAKRIGLGKRIYPHLFRHSFAINFLRQTGNPFALQELGGWSDMETIKIYLRLAQEMPKEAIEKMHFPKG